ncbi:Hypothetical predicted protein, partial [Xyrichtys novacula]
LQTTGRSFGGETISNQSKFCWSQPLHPAGILAVLVTLIGRDLLKSRWSGNRSRRQGDK